MRTWLEQDLERESRGAAGREQMPRLPEVCVRVGQIRCFGLVEAKPFELIDPPQEALVVRTRLKSLTTLCFAVLHISPKTRRQFGSAPQPRLRPAELVRVVVCAELGWPPVSDRHRDCCRIEQERRQSRERSGPPPRLDARYCSVAPKPILLRAWGP